MNPTFSKYFQWLKDKRLQHILFPLMVGTKNSCDSCLKATFPEVGGWYLLPCLKMLSCEGTSPRYVLKGTTLNIWRLSSKIIFLSFQSTKILVVKWIIAAFISRISKFQFLKDFITYRNSCSLNNTKMKSKIFQINAVGPDQRNKLGKEVSNTSPIL